MSDTPIVEMVPKEAPEDPYSHHWVGPHDGDAEPWIWVKSARLWIRGGQSFTPAEMHARGWVYGALCDTAAAVADLRRRLADAEAGRPHRSPSMSDTPVIRRAQFRGVTLSRDELVAEAMEYLTPYRGARNLEDYPAIMADFAMMIAARVALRMTLPPGYVVVPASMIAAATKESEG